MATENIVTPEFRLAFPAVFAPTKYEDTGKEKYEITMLFPKNVDLSALKALAAEAIAEKFGSDRSKWPANLKNPFRDGDVPNSVGKTYDSHAGCIYVKATTLYRPDVVDEQVEPVLSQDIVYAGCYCRAQINAFAYQNKGNVGVSFGLQRMQKLRDGERLSGGGQDPKEVFSAVETPAAGNAGDSFFDPATTGAQQQQPVADDIPF